MGKLRAFRMRNRVKLVELAKLSGIHHSSLSLIENGWRQLKKVEAEKIIAGYKKINIEAAKEILSLAVKK